VIFLKFVAALTFGLKSNAHMIPSRIRQNLYTPTASPHLDVKSKVLLKAINGIFHKKPGKEEEITHR